MKNRSECKKIVEAMKSERLPREERWRQIREFICPWRGILDQRLNDNRNGKEILRFTHVATQSLLRGASGMTSGMTPRNASWFKPDFTEVATAELPGARTWLDAIDATMKDALSEGGFYQSIQAFNTDLIWAGCALLYSEDAETPPLRFECPQLGTWYIALDRRNELSAVARFFRMTCEDMEQAFGKGKVSGRVKEYAKTRPLEKHKVWHLVVRERNGQFPVASYWWEDAGDDGESFLKTGGYYEMPFFYTYWNEGVTPYGTGPGDLALPDARQMDLLERNKLEGLAKMINPPVQAPWTLKGHVKLGPGDINYVADNSTITPILDLNPFARALQPLQQEIEVCSVRLREALIANIFMSMPLEERPAGMSATEYLERKREALQQLGPVISAYEPNVLTPLLLRVVNTLDRKGLLAMAPESLAMTNPFLQMEFISPMANALRQTGAETTRAIIQDVAMLAQATGSLEILDKLDADQCVDEIARGVGAPGSIIRADQDVAALRQQRAEMQAQAQALQEQAIQSQSAMNEAKATESQANAAMTLEQLGNGPAMPLGK